MIATLLDEEQLPALRILSKQACHHFSDIFAKVHFARLRHHFTESSLQDLVQFTNHAMFSKYVKSMEFSTARPKYPSTGSPDSLHEEAREFRRAGRHITMLVTVLENLKHHGNHEVSLGVFDSSCYRMIDGIATIESTLVGHGYIKSYGIGKVLESVDQHGTMLAISEAAKISGYSLQRLSMTTAVRSSTQTKLITNDQANAFLVEGSNQFKSNLMLRCIVAGKFESKFRHIEAACLTVEVQTGASSHLSLQGQTIALDQWLFSRVQRTGDLLQRLPPLFFDNRYRTFTLKDLQLKSQGLTPLYSGTMQQTLKCLELSNVDVWISQDVNDMGPVTFLNHLKRHSNIKNFRISNLTVNANFYVTQSGDRTTPQPLRLAADEIVAEGYDKVQSVFDDLIAQVKTWRGTISRI